MFRNFLKRRRQKRYWAALDKLPRDEYLLAVRLDRLEGGRDLSDGLNFLELVEKQLKDGKLQLALGNIARQSNACFEIANLYWGQGDLANAEKYLRMTLERYQRFIDAGREYNHPLDAYVNYGEVDIKTAAVLLDAEIDGPVRDVKLEPGYTPSFGNFLVDCCLGDQDFDMGAWQALEDDWLRNRFGKAFLTEQAIYMKALTGQYASDDEMLKAHAKMWAGKAKRKTDMGTMGGYGEDNAYIIDDTFAAILKRIGWEGTYRHSWPNTCPSGTPPVTTKPADRHLGIIEAPPSAPDADSGIIEDPQEARRYIDTHVADQRDWWENEHLDPLRPAKERSKVAAGLKEIGWPKNPATIDLMRTYRMDQILNDSTHLFLSDPIGDRYCSLKSWTELFVTEFGMSDEFIAVAESEEKTDYRDPQGGWYVFWKKNKRVYQVERDDWHDPKAAIEGARLGKEMWPNYLSFVAWWVAQHQEPD